MTDLPPLATGDSPLVTWLNKLRQCVAERTPLKSETCDIDKLPNGFRPKPSAVPTQGTVAKSTWLP